MKDSVNLEGGDIDSTCSAHQIEADYLGCLLSEKENDIHGCSNVRVLKDEAVAIDDAELKERETETEAFLSCKMVSVAGLNLALPKSEFEIMKFDPDEIELNNKMGSICYGRLSGSNGHVFVVRVEQILTGDKQARSMFEHENTMVLLKEKNMAFMCDTVLDDSMIDKDEIKPGGNSSRRLWLYGTVKNRNCAVMNADGLLQAILGHLGDEA